MTEPTSTNAPALTDRERRKLTDALYYWFDEKEVAERVEPVVAALVDASRTEGAAAERERIHDEIADRQHAELAATIPPAESAAQAYDYARRIARGGP